MKLPTTITADKACEILGYFGSKDWKNKKLKELIIEKRITKYVRRKSYLFDLEEILELREQLFTHK